MRWTENVCKNFAATLSQEHRACNIQPGHTGAADYQYLYMKINIKAFTKIRKPETKLYLLKDNIQTFDVLNIQVSCQTTEINYLTHVLTTGHLQRDIYQKKPRNFVTQRLHTLLLSAWVTLWHHLNLLKHLLNWISQTAYQVTLPKHVSLTHNATLHVSSLCIFFKWFIAVFKYFI